MVDDTISARATDSIVVTVCTRQRFGEATVAVESVLAEHRHMEGLLCVVDGLEGIDNSRWRHNRIKITEPSKMGRDVLYRVHQMAIAYTPAELCAALKPTVLEYAMEQGYSIIVYVDADTLCYRSMHEALEALVRSTMVLTPHVVTLVPPYPFADLRLLQTGTYNLGFLAVGKDLSSDFLSWWKERCKFYCLDEPRMGLFYDQRWFDVISHVISPFVLTDRGYNVAIWNLHERPLSRRNGQTYAGDRPLTLAHFSGSDRLASNGGVPPWIRDPDTRAIWQDLCHKRVDLVGEHAGELACHVSYGLENLPGGIRIDAGIRAVTRLAGQDELELIGDPFQDSGAFVNWLRGNHPKYHVPRYVAGLWLSSSGALRRAFPTLAGNLKEFLEAVKREGSDIQWKLIV